MPPFLQTPRIHFAFGASATLAEELTALGVARPLLVTDHGVVRSGILERIAAAVALPGATCVFDAVPENPTVEGVARAYGAYRAAACDGIVAVGGGSVIDTAKAVGVLAIHPGPITRYLGHPERITQPIAPLIALPTTAGTGSEASRGAGIHPDATSRAQSLNTPHLVPRVAICDPELTVTLPPRLTAATGMDALSHCVEGFLSRNSNPPLEAVALDGVRRVLGHVERATADGGDRDARWHMMMAGLEGGMSINMGLGPAHALANTFGDRGFHHGTLVTIALPAVLRLLARHVPDKIRALSDGAGCAPGRTIADAIEELNARLGLPASVAALGSIAGDRDEMARDAAASAFNRSSPYHPTAAEFHSLIQTIAG